MEKEFGISDVWRKQNPGIIGITWSNGVKEVAKIVQTSTQYTFTSPK